MPNDLAGGVYIRTRTDGGLFNVAQLCSDRKTRELGIRKLLYADDADHLMTSKRPWIVLLTQPRPLA